MPHICSRHMQVALPPAGHRGGAWRPRVLRAAHPGAPHGCSAVPCSAIHAQVTRSSPGNHHPPHTTTTTTPTRLGAVEDVLCQRKRGDERQDGVLGGAAAGLRLEVVRAHVVCVGAWERGSVPGRGRGGGGGGEGGERVTYGTACAHHARAPGGVHPRATAAPQAAARLFSTRPTTRAHPPRAPAMPSSFSMVSALGSARSKGSTTL